jgi:V-type ATPase 116kDa subunit family
LLIIVIIYKHQLNPNVSAFHRNFVNEVKRCDEMENKLKFFEAQLRRDKSLRSMVNSVSLEIASNNTANINFDQLEVSSFSSTCSSCILHSIFKEPTRRVREGNTSDNQQSRNAG